MRRRILIVLTGLLTVTAGCGDRSGPPVERDINQISPRPLPSTSGDPAGARASYAAAAPTSPPHPPGSICPHGRPPVPARATPGRAVVARVDRAWDRIERWLRAEAPATLATLNPPASTERVVAAESQMSVGFPADLTASLRRHDGARSTNLLVTFQLPPFYGLMSLHSMQRDWETRCAIVERAGDEPGWWWHPKFVPFAEDFAGDCLFVDQRPPGVDPRSPRATPAATGGGRVGHHSHEEGVHFQGEPASLVDLLEATAHALETGMPYERARPFVNEQGGLDWEFV